MNVTISLNVLELLSQQNLETRENTLQINNKSILLFLLFLIS